MALIAFLLGAKNITAPKASESFANKTAYPLYQRYSGLKCTNPNCVSIQETEAKYIRPEFKIVKNRPITLRCVYCEHEVQPQYIASSDWHEGKLDTKKYHSADSHLVDKIKPENLILFDSEMTAQACGFKPSKYTSRRIESR